LSVAPLQVTQRQVDKSRRAAKQVVERVARQDAGQGQRVLEGVVRRHSGKPHEQIAQFFDQFQIPAAIGRRRSTSLRTTAIYKQNLHTLVNTLDEANMKVRNLSDLTPRQVRHAFHIWEGQGFSAGHLATLNTCIRRFGSWIGKPELCKRLHEMLQDPDRAVRAKTSVTSKTWTSRGLNPDEIIKAVADECLITSLHLELAYRFGLRVTEAVSFSAERSDLGDKISVFDGTKGGRPRFVPVETPEQRELLDRCKKHGRKARKGLLMADPNYTKTEARAHFYHVLRKAGLTKTILGVSAHGLRHEYANTLYKKVAGVDAPIEGGPRLVKAAEKKARSVVTQALGHGRTQITSAYIGSHGALDRYHQANLKQINAMVQGRPDLKALVDAGQLLDLFLIGPAAQGKPIEELGLITTAFTYQPGMDAGVASTCEQLSSLLQAAWGVPVFCMPVAHRPDEAFELLI